MKRVRLLARPIVAFILILGLLTVSTPALATHPTSVCTMMGMSADEVTAMAVASLDMVQDMSPADVAGMVSMSLDMVSGLSPEQVVAMVGADVLSSAIMDVSGLVMGLSSDLVADMILMGLATAGLDTSMLMISVDDLAAMATMSLSMAQTMSAEELVGMAMSSLDMVTMMPPDQLAAMAAMGMDILAGVPDDQIQAMISMGVAVACQ